MTYGSLTDGQFITPDLYSLTAAGSGTNDDQVFKKLKGVYQKLNLFGMAKYK